MAESCHDQSRIAHVSGLEDSGMNSSEGNGPRTIHGLKVHQWLDEWDHVEFDPTAHRRRPNEHFYLFSMSASDLKALTGIRRRSLEGRAEGRVDTGVQRAHNADRSTEIARFIRHGFPWSALSHSQRRSGRYDDLKKPGWLPTSIVVNILVKDGDGSRTRGIEVDDDDVVLVTDAGAGSVTMKLPDSFTGSDWTPRGGRYPIEVIDGQHRLWAFEPYGGSPDYQLPVVAFHGLDLSWQAYLFYTINIKPERINASLAYDLYPLLRTEDWLERFEGPVVYREARSQELTHALWATQSSPWHKHINMLGERGLKPMVRQAAWIRSLMATYVKSAHGTRIGGLFGARPGRDVLGWNGAQQAAFLILMGQKLLDAVAECEYEWAETLREEAEYTEGDLDPAFYGAYSLLNSDQGIRGLLFITNDLCTVLAEQLELEDWISSSTGASGAADKDAVEDELDELREHPVADFLDELSSALASFDWRTSRAAGISEGQRILKTTYRGGSGYRELRRQLLLHLMDETELVADAASEVFDQLGYD